MSFWVYILRCADDSYYTSRPHIEYTRLCIIHP